MADKRISQLVERTDIANNDVLPIVASGATTTNKVTISTIQDWMQDNLDVGVTSVGLSMPSAFTVTNSPVTTSGNISVVGAGTVSQYIRGDGSLADFPQGGGGGGASVNYYLNGSVSQGTIGGIAYYEMNKTPILGTGTDFVAIADGYLASFITDAGDPSLLQIPGGNWNFETYFSASSGGGTPTFYVELYKVDSGGTATLIASNSGTPELIAFGTTITPYFSTLAVPTTTLALTDRLALRYYVARSGRTITMHTENSHLCQIITTFTTGLTALNGLTAQVQNFATGTSGSDFNISSSSSTHTFNLPNASATARGVVSTGIQTFAGIKYFNDTIVANDDIQLAQDGTALPTYLKNISGTYLTAIGSNGIGFNGSNNIYFAGSNKNGGVIAFNNTSNQTYTLQDASGTLAFTSQIPTNPVGGTGAAGRVAYWNGSGTITSDAFFQWNDFSKRLGIGRTPTVSLDVEGAGFFSSSVTATNAVLGNTSNNTNAIQFLDAASSKGHIGSGFGATFINNNSFFNGSAYVFDDNTKPNSQITLSAGTVVLSTGAANVDPTAKLTILNNGNVGIGTASPSASDWNASATLLHLYQNSTNGSVLKLESSNASGIVAAFNNAMGLGTTSDDPLLFYTNTTERMRITSGGSVLINQNSVIGNESLNITGKVDGASQFGILVAGDPIAYQAVAMRFFNTNASTVVGSIVINAATTSYNITSDYRLKEDLQEIKGLEKVQAIKVYDYKWKSEESRMDGVLAHELAEVLPYAVTGEKDDMYEDGTEKMQGVDYSKIVPILIKAIQELKTEIDSLKNQIK